MSPDALENLVKDRMPDSGDIEIGSEIGSEIGKGGQPLEFGRARDRWGSCALPMSDGKAFNRDQEISQRHVEECAAVLKHGKESTAVLKVEIKNTGKIPRCHYSIVIEMTKKIDLDHLAWQPPALIDPRPFPLSMREAYRQMLFHGPLLQGIAEVQAIGANGIDGILVPSDPRKLLVGNPPGNWLIDPVIMDSGLQMIILWSRTYWDMMPLPSRFQRFRSLAPLAGSRVRFQSRILPHSVGALGSSEGMLHADLAFFNEEGKLIALLEDMEAACSKSLNRLAEKT